jgi:hypothetical protein
VSSCIFSIGIKKKEKLILLECTLKRFHGNWRAIRTAYIMKCPLGGTVIKEHQNGHKTLNLLKRVTLLILSKSELFLQNERPLFFIYHTTKNCTRQFLLKILAAVAKK